MGSGPRKFCIPQPQTSPVLRVVSQAGERNFNGMAPLGFIPNHVIYKIYDRGKNYFWSLASNLVSLRGLSCYECEWGSVLFCVLAGPTRALGHPQT